MSHAPPSAMPKVYVKPLPPDAQIGGIAYRALFGRAMGIGSAVALAISAILPGNGDLGFSICPLKRMTNLPCPGCGLTRCFTCIMHGRFQEAVHFHPLGPLCFAIAIVGVIGFALGEKRRMPIARWFARHDALTTRVYWGFIWSFIGFGLVRLVLVWAAPGRFFPNI